VVAVGNQPVASVPALLNAVAALKPGEQATVSVQRGAQALQLSLTIVQRQRPRPVASAAPH